LVKKREEHYQVMKIGDEVKVPMNGRAIPATVIEISPDQQEVKVRLSDGRELKIKIEPSKQTLGQMRLG
jgi:sRNA-binding protein